MSAANPLVNFSGVLGNNVLSVGADLSFNTATGNFTRINTGLTPLSNTAVGAEFTHRFSTNENTLTIGTQHALDPLTTLKVRVDNYEKASAFIQHECRPKSFFTVSGEVDTKAIEKSAKVGLALALKPPSQHEI
uniref:Uncharacterized protein n=1 Tax=Kalanchoe fedtschenkoi TaxID=63787 RepID=A0A7N0VKK9_KALFE